MWLGALLLTRGDLLAKTGKSRLLGHGRHKTQRGITGIITEGQQTMDDEGFYVSRFPNHLVVAYQGQNIAEITPAYARTFAAALQASADAAEE
jgi:hypothetical protein